MNLLKFLPIFAHFTALFDVFFLSKLPKHRIFTYQPPFLTQKQGIAPEIRKKNPKIPNFPQFLKNSVPYFVNLGKLFPPYL